MSTEPAPDAMLANLQARYKAELSGKKRVVLAAWLALQDDPGDVGRSTALQEPVHRIAGSAGSFGLPELSVAARSVDQLLRALAPESAADATPALAEAMAVLLAMMEQLTEP